MAMNLTRTKLLNIALLFLGGIFTWNALAAEDSLKAGGIGGTGSPMNRQGIGGTGSPVMNGGIGGTGSPVLNSEVGGTGVRTNDKSTDLAIAGNVIFVVGKVEAEHHGQVRSLAKGASVRVGDTLKSAQGAMLQLRMVDGGTIVLRPVSQLVIESFAYKGVQDGSEHLSLALLNGGFRAVTGEIGHLHKENYRIHTPNARIGIMGTDHETVFVPDGQQVGQVSVLAPGTYNHVISGGTVLQNEKSKLLIKPNQTGFMSLKSTNPILIATPVKIFNDPKFNLSIQRQGDSLSAAASDSDSDQDLKGSSNSGVTNGSTSGTVQNSNGTQPTSGQNSKTSSNSGSVLETDQDWSNPTQGTQQNKVTQTENLAATKLDLDNLDPDAMRAESGSAVVGALFSGGLQKVGSAQAGSPGQKVYVETDNMPSMYVNNNTGSNFVSVEDVDPVNTGTTIVDGVTVTWGIYANGITFDSTGKPISVNFHPFAFAYANGGATPAARITAIGGMANFSTVAGFTPPVTESGNIGGTVILNVGVNLTASTLTNFNLNVVDANSSPRTWTGVLNNSSPVSLASFAQGGASLTVTCTGNNCGSGIGNGSAAGILLGPNAKGLISSYILTTSTGQGVAGTVIQSRP